jgi:hypothetical protein
MGMWRILCPLVPEMSPREPVFAHISVKMQENQITKKPAN